MRALVSAVGDGALGYWAAPSGTSSRRSAASASGCIRRLACWKRYRRAGIGEQDEVNKEITEAENKILAREAFKGFEERFGKKGPKAAAKIVPDEKALLAYYDYLAEHWRHL